MCWWCSTTTDFRLLACRIRVQFKKKKKNTSHSANIYHTSKPMSWILQSAEGSHCSGTHIRVINNHKGQCFKSVNVQKSEKVTRKKWYSVDRENTKYCMSAKEAWAAHQAVYRDTIAAVSSGVTASTVCTPVCKIHEWLSDWWILASKAALIKTLLNRLMLLWWY